MARLPDQIGKYDVVERIGKGGMGMVYKATHPTLDRFVILKKLNISGDPTMRERFRREAEIMIDFRTDYVVDVYDHFKHASSDYIVLEYVDGIALDELLSRERYLDTDLALLIARDCFRGLDYVHGKGVVHRDVKPGNVLVGRDGAVKLLDFGIASRVTGFDDELTRDGMTLGTVAYIAPEQIERSRDVDRRADIYSAGAMLYEMVTGRKAFAGGFNPETVNRIQRGRYRHPRRVNPRVSPLASRVIRRCMKRKPNRRYQHAGAPVKLLDAYFVRRGETDLRARLAELAGGPAAKPPAHGPRRHRPGRLIAAAVVLLAVAGIVGWTTGAIQRLVLARTHALVRFEVRLRKSDRTVAEHFIRTELTRIEAGEPVRVGTPVPLLRAVGGLETPDYVVLRSRLFTLPAGRYEALVRVEDATAREVRSLVPAAIESAAQFFTARWDPKPDAELDLSVDVYDTASGATIADAALELERDGRWVALVRRGEGWATVTPVASSFGEDAGLFGVPSLREPRALTRPLRLAPGASIRVRAGHPDYLSAVATVSTARETDAAALRIGLAPRPATVLINSRIDDAELRVDGATTMVAPGPEPLIVDTPRLFAGVTEIGFVPGSYRLEARAGASSDTLDVDLPPGSRATFRLSESADGIDLVLVQRAIVEEQ